MTPNAAAAAVIVLRRPPSAAPAAPTLGLVRRCLIGLTSRRFCLERDVASPFRHHFARFERAGWALRVAPPRHFVQWRGSALVTASPVPLVFLPEARLGLGDAQQASLCLFELLRRVVRVELLERGLTPSLADQPWAIRLMQEATLRVLFTAEFCRRCDASRWFAELERRLDAAVLRDVA